MKTLMHVTGLAFLLCAWPYCCAEVVANAAPTPTGSPKSATEACETAVTDAIQEARGRDVHPVQFVAAKRTVSPALNDEASVRGEGRYRAPSGFRTFNYSCSFNEKTQRRSVQRYQRSTNQCDRQALAARFNPSVTRSLRCRHCSRTEREIPPGRSYFVRIKRTPAQTSRKRTRPAGVPRWRGTCAGYGPCRIHVSLRI